MSRNHPADGTDMLRRVTTYLLAACLLLTQWVSAARCHEHAATPDRHDPRPHVHLPGVASGHGNHGHHRHGCRHHHEHTPVLDDRPRAHVGDGPHLHEHDADAVYLPAAGVTAVERPKPHDRDPSGMPWLLPVTCWHTVGGPTAARAATARGRPPALPLPDCPRYLRLLTLLI